MPVEHIQLTHIICLPLSIAQTNTFQVVLATNGNKSFTLFQYADLQWALADPRTDTSTSTASAYGSGGGQGTTTVVSGSGSGSGSGNAVLAQVGFSAGDGMRYYKLNASGTDDVVRLNSTSNIDRPGLWIFRVDGPSVVRRGMFVVSFFPVMFYITICIAFFPTYS